MRKEWTPNPDSAKRVGDIFDHPNSSLVGQPQMISYKVR